MKPQFTIHELAARVNGVIEGDGAKTITNVAALEFAADDEIAFVTDAKFYDAARQSNAGCLIAAVDFAAHTTLILVENPKLAFAKIAEVLHPPKKYPAAIHQSAIIRDGAITGANVYVGAFVNIGKNSRVGDETQIHHGAHIGDNVRIGKNCVLHPNVCLTDDVTIGDNVILHANVVIGAPGFGFVRDGANGYVNFPQIGTVIIENNVEIGANSCVDRAALGETRIGQGTKIDNLVQIAHNVIIGERVIIAAQTGISGSTIIESDAVIGGQVGMGDHARVESGAIIGSKAGVLPGKIVRRGVWWGVPVQPLDEYKRQNAHVRALPRMRDEIKALTARLNELETRFDDE